jgi:hypothetical protein
MIAATILPLMGAKGDPARAVALAWMLALFTGAVMVLAGAGKLGFIADLLSKPTNARLHERVGADHPGRSAPEALRLLRRRP